MTSIWNPDFVASYFPSLKDISPEVVQSARNRMESWLRAGWPDEDMQPGSVVGDRVLTPFAFLMAGLEVAAGRLMSDLDTSQIAQNIIFNCDFVSAFLQNFAVQDSAVLQSSGMLQLVFSDDAAIQLDRSLQFQLDGNSFTMDLPYSGPMNLVPVGGVALPGQNFVIFTDLGNSRYAANVRVLGGSGKSVTANTTAATSVPVANLLTATALNDFYAGSAVTSLPELARMTRQTFPAAALTSRASAISAMTRLFPGLIGSYPSMTGDAVMLRDSVNALGIASPRVDMHVRSPYYDYLASVTVNIPFFATQNAAALNQFITELALPGNPTFIKDVTSVSNPDVVLIPGISANVWSASLNNARCPLLTCAGTAQEQLWLTFPMPVDALTSSDLLVTQTDGDGNRFAQFVVRYYYDPVLASVAARLDSPDCKPANAEILTRPFIPVIISNFQIRYTKLPGQVVDTASASEEIYQYLRNLTSPEKYSDAKVSDALFYRGAHGVRGISVSARVWWSAGSLLIPNEGVTPDTDYVTALANSANYPVPAVYIRATSDLELADFVELTSKAAAKAATICFIIDKENITFVEELL